MTDAIDLAVSTVIFAIRPDADGGRGTLSLPLVRRTREPFARRTARNASATPIEHRATRWLEPRLYLNV